MAEETVFDDLLWLLTAAYIRRERVQQLTGAGSWTRLELVGELVMLSSVDEKSSCD